MTEPSKIKASLIGFDNLVEDLFGLNAKAFRSIWDSFLRPKAYAAAANLEDWSGRFTPSVRVWIGLVTFYSALRFFYGSEDGTMTQMYKEMFDQAVEQDPTSPYASIDRGLFAQLVLKWTFIFFPPIMLLLYACLAFIFRVWPDKPGFVVRFRYIMLTLLPGTTLMTLLTIGFVFVQGLYLAFLLVFSTVGLVICDAITAYRGTLHGVDRKSRLGLSVVLAVLLFIAFLVGSILAAIPAGMAAMAEVTR